MKYMFLVDEWLEFPQTEYGGLVCVIAESEDECIEILTEEEDGYYKTESGKIPRAVQRAKVFAVEGDYESGIVAEFRT